MRDQTDWTSLRDAYGSAQKIPELLVEAEGTGYGAAPAWHEVWSRLRHQGTVYSASFAALTLLADMAERGGDDAEVVALAAAIVASTDIHSGTTQARVEHSESIRRLHGCAISTLKTAGDDCDFLYGLEAVMAFEDGSVWQRSLSYLVGGELPLECPSCGESLFLTFDGPDHLFPVRDDPLFPPTSIQPTTAPLGSVEERILSLCLESERTELAAKLRYVLGHGTCPNCDAAFELAAGLS